ncbi:hypothetical protein ACLVWQ_17720 (plasmid) [Streptomyces sp. CWNU-52B]|uniref:hypothetical protein n=1 Tax=unclassified Streptomyces TaxID=2593676 RepID=UPI0039C35198
MSADRLVTVICVVGATFCAWRVRSALRGPLERARLIADATARTADDGHDVGPDALRLLEDLDAHLDGYFARVSHLFEELGSPPVDPAGLDRLRAAVRDDQPKGDRL